MTKRALLIVDVQNDFLPGGALGVREGDRIIPTINALQQKGFDLIVASKDWHPANHCSFASTHHRQIGDIVDVQGVPQVLWPVHCVAGSWGAEFANTLNQERIAHVVLKGVNPNIDSYSTFADNAHQRSTGLAEYLHEHRVQTLYIAGLATDYCVKFSVLDALGAGFKVYVIQDACRAVNLHEQDEKQALDAMKAAGATLLNADDVV